MAEVLPVGSDIDFAMVTPQPALGRVALPKVLAFGQKGVTSVAAGGSVRGSGPTLAAAINTLGVVSASATHFSLPAATVVGLGGDVHVFNNATVTALLDTQGVDSIDGGASSVSATLSGGARAVFEVQGITSLGGGAWVSFLKGAKSA